MQAFLVRVGIDKSDKSGNWNAPVNPETGEFAYVPILETGGKNGEKKIRPGYEEISYEQFKVPCGKLGRELPSKFDDKPAHLDPDFEYLTYGDEGDRGKPIWGLANGDILAFYASFHPVKPCEDKLIYALIGLYVVDRVTPAREIPENCGHKNAHTRRLSDETDIVVFAKPDLSGRLERYIRIGERRGKGKAYRVTEKLLDEWGRLLVNDGWIQRSAVLPSFLNPERFYEWFKEEIKKQHIRLVRRNNLV